eukprot:6213745-Pleurochrysis_carterae.AAC.3
MSTPLSFIARAKMARSHNALIGPFASAGRFDYCLEQAEMQCVHAVPGSVLCKLQVSSRARHAIVLDCEGYASYCTPAFLHGPAKAAASTGFCTCAQCSPCLRSFLDIGDAGLLPARKGSGFAT